MLSVAPQAYFDYKSSTTMREFYKQSIYSQPTNVTAAVAGIAMVKTVLELVSLRLVGRGVALGVIIAIGWMGSLATQHAFVLTKTDKAIGGFFIDEQ